MVACPRVAQSYDVVATTAFAECKWDTAGLNRMAGKRLHLIVGQLLRCDFGGVFQLLTWGLRQLQLVQAAPRAAASSRDHGCIVSWNHCSRQLPFVKVQSWLQGKATYPCYAEDCHCSNLHQ